MEDAILYILYEIARLNYSDFRPNQRKVIDGYASEKVVFFCSSIGNGKLFTFVNLRQFTDGAQDMLYLNKHI